MPIDFPSVPGINTARGDFSTRLREAAYTTPSGTRIKFQVTESKRSTNLRGTIWEFADAEGGYVQRSKFGPRTYPLRCIFSGETHDLEAQAFEAGLVEEGMGQLEHPRYGTVSVVPFGVLEPVEFLVDDAAATYVPVTFFTSITDLYPGSINNAKSEITKAIEGFDVESAQEFIGNTSLLTAATRASTGSTIRSFLREISSALRTVSDQTAIARKAFSDQFDLVNYSMDVLIGQPLLLAQQVSGLIRAPGRALTGIKNRLAGYGRLLDSLIASDAGSPGSAYTQIGLALRQKNDLRVTDLMAQNAVIGAVIATLETPNFQTRDQAIAAATELLAMADTLVNWRDASFASIGEVDTGEAFSRLHQIVSLAAGNLIQISFSKVAERRITLDRPRTIIDLCAELYGQVDERLDLMIQSNGLTGDEILELPRGRTILYYPAS